MKILTLKGQIELLSGLHIGGGDDTMKIGGIDSQVIKDINTNKPWKFLPRLINCIISFSLRNQVHLSLHHLFL